MTLNARQNLQKLLKERNKVVFAASIFKKIVPRGWSRIELKTRIGIGWSRIGENLVLSLGTLHKLLLEECRAVRIAYSCGLDPLHCALQLRTPIFSDPVYSITHKCSVRCR